MHAQLRPAGRKAGRTALAFAAALVLAAGAAHADGGDFGLDFTAAAPDSYDHRLGGGAYDDRTVGTDIVESLEGQDFMCGELVSYLTQIEVESQVSDPSQTIELGFVVAGDENYDNEFDANVRGDDDCAIETGVELAMGLLNASSTRLNDGTRRSALDSARMSAARQAVTAWCNETLLETNGGLDWDVIRATLAGDSIAAINALQDLLNTFNLSGDLLPITLPIDLGPSDSSYPWGDPTDPVDPGDTMVCPKPNTPSSACGMGVELVLVLPLILALRGHARRG